MSTLRHLAKYVRGESLNLSVLNGRGLNLVGSSLGNLVFGLGLISGSLGQIQSLNFGCFNAFLANFKHICSFPVESHSPAHEKTLKKYLF